MTSYLTTPNAQKTTQRTYRYMCELVSDELELDSRGIPVPKDYRTVDVLVTEPTLAAIASLISAAGWLDGYTMVSDWVPDDGCPF